MIKDYDNLIQISEHDNLTDFAKELNSIMEEYKNQYSFKKVDFSNGDCSSKYEILLENGDFIELN